MPWSCTPPLPEEWVDFRGSDQGVSIPQRVDSGVFILQDSSLTGVLFTGDGMVPDFPKIERNQRVLLLDMAARRSTNWLGLRRQLERDGYELVVRKMPPQLSQEDLTGSFGAVMIAAGNSPGGSDSTLDPAVVPHLSRFVRFGGHLLLLSGHGWSDSDHGAQDRQIFNDILGALELRAQILPNSLVGDVYRSESGTTPHHTSRPWSYVTPVEPLIGLPVGFPARHLRPVEGVEALALGWTSSIACEDASIEVLVQSHADIVSWNQRISDSELTPPGQPLPVAIQADRVHGRIAVLPRSIVELPFHSVRGADQPILEPNLLDGTQRMAAELVARWAVSASDGVSVEHPGCFTADFPLDDEENIDALEDTETMPVEPLPDFSIDIDRPRWAEISPTSEATRPEPLTWPEGDKIALMYGELLADDRIRDHIERMQLADLDAYVAYVPANPLMTYDGTHATARQIHDLAQRASDAGLNLFLAAHYKNENYPAMRNQLERIVDARGHVIDAPSPCSEVWWSTQFMPLVLGAARASLARGLRGLVIDTELYNSGVIAYGEHHGYDDECWSITVNEIETHDPAIANEARGVERHNRSTWLTQRGLRTFSYHTLEIELARKARDIVEAARAINPAFEIHLYLPTLQTSWFYRALYRGFGSPSRPIMILSYDHRSTALQAYLQSQGYAVLTIDGIVGARLSAENMYRALRNAASGSSGYWIFDLIGMNTEGNAQDPPAQYWQQLQRLNEQLDEGE